MNTKNDDDKKIRITTWLSPNIVRQCDSGAALSRSKSRSEFVEKAVSFYSGYLAAQAHTDFLAAVISEMVEGAIDTTENRLAKLLFKVAVEMAKLQQMLASISNMDDETMRRLHIRCVDEVKRINGILKAEDVMKNKRSGS